MSLVEVISVFGGFNSHTVLSEKLGFSPVRLTVTSALRPADEGRCDGEGHGRSPFAEPELRSRTDEKYPQILRKTLKNLDVFQVSQLMEESHVQPANRE